MKVRHIAIDGVASSGKTTVGKILSKKLNYEFIDSGLFYRFATYRVIELNKDPLLGMAKLSKDKYKEALSGISIDFKDGKLYVDGLEFPLHLLRQQMVDELVSPVSEDASIRESITSILRNIASNKNVVMVGRDIGSVVLKDAFLKVFLTATLEERAKRRFKELIANGVETTFSKVYENLKLRDMVDSSRSIAPLIVPKDAYVIDTTDKTVEEVIELILTFMKAKEYALQHSKNNI